MVTFRPFRAVRPRNQKLAKKIASYPYDVINSKEAREIVKGNKYSFFHIVKPEIDIKEYFKGKIAYNDERVYAKARKKFEKFQNKKWLIQDEKPYFYIYRQIMDSRSQYGLVGCVSGQDYWDNKIKKHEKTRKDKEEDRIRHAEVVNANAGPVFLFYPKSDEIKSLVDRIIQKDPIYDITTEDTLTHTVWQISDETDILTLIKIFENIPHVYVADGHHRTASGAIIAKRRAEANPNHTGNEEYNFFLATIFPSEDLFILDYNRLVKDLNGLSKDEFLTKVAEKFDIQENYTERKPTEKRTFGMYLEGKWYLLKAKEGTYVENDPIKCLDVYILMEYLLSPILGIGDPKTDKRIDFVGGIRGMDELEKRVNDGMKIAFSMYPTTIEELMNVADAELLMPPKSTWFEPKLRSGLFTHTYEE